MSAPSLYRPLDEAPATLSRTSSSNPGSTERFEFVSRGDFVNGLLDLPVPAEHPAPLLLVLHGTGASAEDESLDIATPWTEDGLAVARIDLPLHGRRASPKLSRRLVESYHRLAAGDPLDADDRALLEEFARQSTSDVVRACEALGALPEIDASRVALMGIGVGAASTAWAQPHVAGGIRACVLGGGVGRFSDAGFDPAGPIAAAARPTRWLALSVAGDPEVSSESASKLYETLPDSTEQHTAPAPERAGGVAELGWSEIRGFLGRALGL